MTNAFFVIGCAGIALAFALYIDSKPEKPEKTEKKQTEKTEPKNKDNRITNKELYEKAKHEETVLRNAVKIAEYNKSQEIYSGADDTSSKRLYFARQAYKKSRRSVPIIPLSVENTDTTDEIQVEPKERLVVPPRNIKISKNAWEHRDPPSSVVSSSFE